MTTTPPTPPTPPTPDELEQARPVDPDVEDEPLRPDVDRPVPDPDPDDH